MNIVPFFSAIKKSDLDTFQELINRIPDIQLLDLWINQEKYSNWFTGIGFTLLQIVSFVKPPFAKPLLDKGAKEDFFTSCALGHLQNVQSFMRSDPDIINQSIDSYFPIQFALTDAAILNYLLENGEDANRSLLKMAWFEWEDQAAKRGYSEWRPLHMIALGRKNHPTIPIAETLLKHGADLESMSSPFGESAIHIAAIYNNVDLIRWLVTHKVDVDSRTNNTSSNFNINDLFDPKDFYPFSSYLKTPLMIALGEGHLDTVNFLIEQGADIHAIDSEGFSPLHYAAGSYWQEQLELTAFLLKKGADKHAKDKKGRTAASIAKNKNYTEVVNLLYNI